MTRRVFATTPTCNGNWRAAGLVRGAPLPDFSAEQARLKLACDPAASAAYIRFREKQGEAGTIRLTARLLTGAPRPRPAPQAWRGR